MTKNYKRYLIFLVSIILMLSIALSGCKDANEEAVAKVNGEIVSREEFDQNFEMYKKIYEDSYGPDILSKSAGENKTFEDLIKENVLEKLITEEIILQEAEKENLIVSNEDVDNEINSYKQLIGGEEKFNEFLKENNMDIDYFRQGLKKEMSIEKYKDNFISGLKIDDEEIKKVYDNNPDAYLQVRASHILVKEREEAEEILNELKNGADFAKIAEEKSEDQRSAVNGGDLGYFTKGEMVPEFAEAAFSMDIGQISDIVETQYGYHIIKVTDKLDSFEKVKENVKNDVLNEKYAEHLQQLRDEADVEILLSNNEEK